MSHVLVDIQFVVYGEGKNEIERRRITQFNKSTWLDMQKSMCFFRFLRRSTRSAVTTATRIPVQAAGSGRPFPAIRPRGIRRPPTRPRLHARDHALAVAIGRWRGAPRGRASSPPPRSSPTDRRAMRSGPHAPVRWVGRRPRRSYRRARGATVRVHAFLMMPFSGELRWLVVGHNERPGVR